MATLGPAVLPSSGRREAAGRSAAQGQRLKDNLAGYAFLAPQLIGLLVFMIGPLVFAVALSLSRWDGFGDMTFVGVANFGAVLTDPQLFRSVVNTVWFTVLQVPGVMVSGLCVALMLQ